MATEGPMLHDGSQCTAGQDFSGVTSGLVGEQSSGQFLAVKVSAGRTVVLSSSGADIVYGILQNKPASGQAADVGIFGVMKWVAGTTFAGGVALEVDGSGRCIPQTANNRRVAMSLESSGATGQVITVAIVPGVAASLT